MERHVACMGQMKNAFKILMEKHRLPQDTGHTPQASRLLYTAQYT